MGTLPKFLVNVVGGRLVVTASNGEDMNEDHAKWLKGMIARELRTRNWVNAFDQGEGVSVDESLVVRDRQGKLRDREVDPIIIQLNKERIKIGITVEQWAKAAFTTRSRLTDYIRGAARPYLEVLRPLAYVLGFDVELVPRRTAAPATQSEEDHVRPELQSAPVASTGSRAAD